MRKYLFPSFLIISAFSLRIFRHYGLIHLPPNFAPISAIAIFSAVYFNDKRLAVVVPMLSMVISDFFIGFYDLRILTFVYLSFVFSGMLGFWVRRKKGVLRIFLSSLFASLFFFIVTNFAVWAFSKMYDPNLKGLIMSYVMGLPFFKWTILGDMFYTFFLFGTYEAVCFFSSLKKRIII